MTRPIHLDRRIMEIDAEYARRLAVGFPAILGGQPETLQVARDEDRTNWLTFKGLCDEGIASGLPDEEAPISIRTTANRNYAVTYSEGADLMRDMRTWAAAMMVNRWALKDAAHAATTAEALNAVDITQGWP